MDNAGSHPLPLSLLSAAALSVINLLSPLPSFADAMESGSPPGASLTAAPATGQVPAGRPTRALPPELRGVPLWRSEETRPFGEQIPRTTDLMRSASRGDIAEIRALLDHDATQIHARDERQRTALLWAAGTAHVEAASLLLNRGADPNARDEEGRSALMFAAAGNHPVLAKALLAAGGDVNQRDNEGRSALSFAAGAGNGDIVSLLIDHGAEIDRPDRRGIAPLFFAVTSPNPAAALSLLEHGASARIRMPKTGFTLLHLAARRGHASLVAPLKSAGVDVNATGSHGVTALMLAAERDRADFVKALLSAGAAVDARDSGGRSVLHLASGLYGGPETVRLLLASGADADVNTPARNGRTPLIWSSASGNSSVVAVLLEHGADVNRTGPNGFSALMAAAVNGRLETVKLLLKAGAKVDQVDVGGKTALYWSVKQENPDIIATLLRAGADPDVATKEGTTPRQLAEALNLAAFFPPPELTR